MKFILKATNDIFNVIDELRGKFNISKEMFTHTQYMPDVYASSIHRFNEMYPNDTWESHGINHRLSETGVPMRDIECSEYTIEINNLQDLLSLNEICGEDIIIAYNRFYNNNPREIEVYNYYRE